MRLHSFRGNRPEPLVRNPGQAIKFPRLYRRGRGPLRQSLFRSQATQDKLYAALAPVTARFLELAEAERHAFRGQLTDFVRLYAFLSQVLTFADTELEKLYVFARNLRRILPEGSLELPREVQQNIDMESYRIQQTGSGGIGLKRGNGVLEPIGSKRYPEPSPEQLEPLSRIIAELNERFGLNLGPSTR